MLILDQYTLPICFTNTLYQYALPICFANLIEIVQKEEHSIQKIKTGMRLDYAYYSKLPILLDNEWLYNEGNQGTD